MLSKKTPSFFSCIGNYVIITRKGWAKVGGATMPQDNQRIISVIFLRTENSSWMSNSNICSVLNANAYVPDSDWHLAPVYPSWQLQVYPLILSVHDPPFKQGLLEHSLMSVAKRTIWEKTTFHGNILRLITSFVKTIQGPITLKIFLTCLTLCSCVSRLTATSISINLVSTWASV